MNLPPFARWNNPVGNNYPRKLHFRRIKFPAVKVLRLRCWGSLQIIAQQLGNFSCRASTLSLLTVHKHGAAVFFCHSRTLRRVHTPDRGNLLLCHCEPCVCTAWQSIIRYLPPQIRFIMTGSPRSLHSLAMTNLYAVHTQSLSLQGRTPGIFSCHCERSEAIQ